MLKTTFEQLPIRLRCLPAGNKETRAVEPSEPVN
jgi:hypothetical protein